MQRLYEHLKTTKQIVGQSAVGAAMGESPQTVKNWEYRGISQRGANLAQKKFDCDANWLLGTKAQSAAAPTAAPDLHLKVKTTEAAWGWPFKSITVAQYSQLDEDQRIEIEKYVMLQIKAREQPIKHETLAHIVIKDKAA